MALIGINADQAMAKDKARQGAKVRAGKNARIATAPGSTKRLARPKSKALDNNAATDDRSLVMRTVEKAELTAGRKKVAGADAFSIDIGTSENLRSQVGSARRKSSKFKR